MAQTRAQAFKLDAGTNTSSLLGTDAPGSQGATLELASYHRPQAGHAAAGHGHGNSHGSDSHHQGKGHGGKHPDAAAIAADNAAANTAAPLKSLPSQHGFVAAMQNYWTRLTSAKNHGKFFNAYPPVYSGMDEPRVASATPPPADAPVSFKSPGKLPSLSDLVSASKDLNRIASADKTKPDFNLSLINEVDFKERYAAETLVIGRNYGLNGEHTANLVKRIYAFEDGGWGTHFTLSGMPQAIMDKSQQQARMNFHPASSAMGYNQLLIKTTVNDIAMHGDEIAGRLNALAAAEPARAQVLHDKAQLVHNLQEALNHRVKAPPHKRGEKSNFFSIPSARRDAAIQALNLDGDIGPVIQSQEINGLLKYSAANKFGDYLNVKAADRTSHARDYDALPADKKAAAINQLFGLIKPQEVHPDNPALDAPFYATRDGLRKKIEMIGTTGADRRLERENLTDAEFKMMNGQVLTIRRYGGAGGPLSPEARALLDRVTYDYFGGFSAEKLQAAAIEMANLAGPGSAQLMLKAENSKLPTSNFFAKDGYIGNPVTSRRSAEELLLQIYRIMHGPNSENNKPGMAQFDAVFKKLGQRDNPNL